MYQAADLCPVVAWVTDDARFRLVLGDIDAALAERGVLAPAEGAP